MVKKMRENNHSLTELEIKQLREQRNKIITNAVFAAAGALDVALLKTLSNTVGTDDMTVNDLIFLFLGGSACYLGSVLMGVNAIDYMDMKKDFNDTVNDKRKIKIKRRNIL